MIEYDFHEAANAFPFISGDLYESLKKDIQSNGIIEPVTLYEGKILDGRNRYRIAIELGLDDIPVCAYEGDNPSGFVQSMNLHRRQLTPSQRAAAAAFLADFRQGQHGDEEEYETQADMAKKLGVSRRMVVEATSLKKKGDIQLVESVRNGEISLHNATALARLPPEEQRSIINEGAGKAKEVAKKIKAMTKGKGRIKKDAQERMISLDKISGFEEELPDPDDKIVLDMFDDSEGIQIKTDINNKKSLIRTRKKRIEINEASAFGHSLIDAIISLGTTANDTNGGASVIDAALSKSQLSLFFDDYDAVELRSLLSAGIKALGKLVND